MSRVGIMPVKIPDGANIQIGESEITVEGPKGVLKQNYSPEVTIAVDNDKAVVSRTNESKRAKSMHGLYRNLLNNMVIGVTSGFSKTLLINGVGYRAEVQNDILTLNLGYSNPIEVPIPEELNITCEGNTRIIVSGIDKQKVGQLSADIRSLRPPEPYKGKGIRYENEYVRRKIGKAGIK